MIRRGSCRSVWCLPIHRRNTWRLFVHVRRVWCFLIHRHRVPTVLWAHLDEDTYICRRCSEIWSRP